MLRVLLNCFCLFCLCVPPSTAQQRQAATTPDDPVLRAMREEMERARQLRVAGGVDVPYFFEYALDSVRGYAIEASLGGIVNERRNQIRIPRVTVRTGSYEFDNSNYVLSDGFFTPRFDFEQLPLDDNLAALRHQFWLATDRAFKNALEGVGRKRAALRGLNLPQEQPPDFWKAEPVKLLRPISYKPVDEEVWKSRTLRISRVFAAHDKVLSSSVDFESGDNASYVLNSEGTEVRYPDQLHFLRMRAVGQAADGMIVRDHAVVHALDLARMPTEDEMRRLADEVAKNVTALSAAPLGEGYNGPVLFEGSASAQLFAEVLGTQLTVPRRPIPEPGRPLSFLPSDLEGRIGSRILPDSFDITDNPTPGDFQGRPLLGAIEVDIEGVTAKPVTVVAAGQLKDVLRTRQPIAGFTDSNGRARIPGGYGHKRSGITNLMVKSKDGVDAAELKKRLIALIQQRNKPYGILIKKMDFPSSASIDEVRRLAASLPGAGGHIISSPLLTYRVYPDGREELVRGVRFRSLNVRSLKDILASSKELYQFDFIGNAAPFSLIGAAPYVYTTTCVAPAILFEDLEMERPQTEQPKLPVVAPPPLTR